MGAVFFYHLTRSPLEATLPMLLGKARAVGWRVLVRGGNSARLKWLDEKLWLGGDAAFLAHGLSGGEPWFTDYGIELSRGFTALKVWAVIMATGTRALGAQISDNCEQARLMGELVQASKSLHLAHPVISNLCCFYVDGAEADTVATALQISGKVVFSTTNINGRACLRAAIVNHRTTKADIHAAIGAVEEMLTNGGGVSKSHVPIRS